MPKTPEFFEFNPANPDTARQILIERSNLKDISHPIDYLAGKLIASASGRLSEIDRMYSSEHGHTANMSGMVFRGGLREVAQIVYGSTMIGIADAKNTGSVHVQEAYSRINNELGKTSISKVPFPQLAPVRAMSETEMAKIKAAFAKDNTGSIFIEDSRTLPNDLVRVLDIGEGSLRNELLDTAHKWRDLLLLVIDMYDMKKGIGLDKLRKIPGAEALLESGLSVSQIQALISMKEKIRDNPRDI